MDRLHVATLNIRNLADRWYERLPLLLADMAALQPDLLGLQEVVYADAAGPAHRGGRRGPLRRASAAGPAGRSTATACSSGSRSMRDRGRAARPRAEPRRRIARSVALPGGASVLVVVTHLHHLPPDEAIRDEQAARAPRLAGRRTRRRRARSSSGDFNAEPDEPAPRRIAARRLPLRLRRGERRGAGGDLAVGLQAPAMDTDGDPGCLDYIWVRGAVRVESAPARASTARTAEDPTLYPSDHLGIAARLEIG